MANVFVSHRGTDTVLAEKLATEIRVAGHAVWLDEWEIKVGDQIIQKINEGLEGSTYLVLCYSSVGMAPWINIEWGAALSAQLNGKNVKVLPVRLSGSDAPAILEGTKYADLIKDWTSGVSDLLRAIV